jgi:hypothetical protein
MRALRLLAAFALGIAFLPGQPAEARQKGWYERAVKKLEAKFEPAEAKPGQTVTFTLTVDLNLGYHTYPTVQPDKMAADMVNIMKFPDPGPVVFVGKVTDPKDFDVTAEPELGIKEIRINEGKVVYTRKAVVSPKASPGAATVKLASFKLMVCDEKTCFPPKTVQVEAAFKVLDGPAVPVEKAYADEVAKALAGK